MHFEALSEGEVLLQDLNTWKKEETRDLNIFLTRFYPVVVAEWLEQLLYNFQ